MGFILFFVFRHLVAEFGFVSSSCYEVFVFHHLIATFHLRVGNLNR